MTARAITVALTCGLVCGCVYTAPASAQTGHRPRRGTQVREAAGKGTNVLWRNPGRVEMLDLASGVGGRAKAPKPPFRFLEEDTTGSNPKIKVRDARGVEWSLKWGEEAKPEVFASRLAWACGYIAQPEYYVRSGRMSGVKRLRRAKAFVEEDGTFQNARFQLRSRSPKFLKKDNWSWSYNPFVGTKELNGLKVLMMLTSNWDNKDARDIDRDSNLGVFEERRGGRPVFFYFVADWGASMGKWGHVYNRNKWDCKGYREQSRGFVKGVENGVVEWGYVGQHTEDAAKGIRVSDVAWLMHYLGRITEHQIRAGLSASGADAAETECFTAAVRSRIEELRRVAKL
ncbi:MAG: hypothetical protein M3Z32_07130 [Acidobacteriota bacterium]|nr:hypothetical protein [Acidobacteriota bacterium]